MKSKTWIAWASLAIAAAGLGTGVVLFRGANSPSLAEMEPDVTRHVARSARDDSPWDRASAGFYDDTADDTSDETAKVRPHPADGEARAVQPEPERADPIEEEIRRTERALAASRRISEPTAEGKQESASQASGEALAAAAAGSSAVALGCDGEGFACRSGADCCPGLACAGGVAGYGTVGRCQAPH